MDDFDSTFGGKQDLIRALHRLTQGARAVKVEPTQDENVSWVTAIFPHGRKETHVIELPIPDIFREVGQ